MESQRAPYRNAIRSHTLIRNAFLQLIREKCVTKIKVKDVIEYADVSKGTFYAHYNSIFDIYEEIENEYVALLFKVFEEQSVPITFENLLPLFLSGLEEIEKQRDTFLILFRCEYRERFLGKVKQRFLVCMLDHCGKDIRFEDKDLMKGFFTFVAGGALTLIGDWIDEKQRPSSSSCAHFLNNCITHGIQVIQPEK